MKNISSLLKKRKKKIKNIKQWLKKINSKQGSFF